jgi:hypothetical protein
MMKKIHVYLAFIAFSLCISEVPANGTLAVFTGPNHFIGVEIAPPTMLEIYGEIDT